MGLPCTCPPPLPVPGIGLPCMCPPPLPVPGMGLPCTCPPPLPVPGIGRPWAKRTVPDELAECIAAIFRNPVAPDNTSNTKATTARHFDIYPPDGKLTRRQYMYVCSAMEQNCYRVSKRSIPSDNVPRTAWAVPYGAVSFSLSTSNLGLRTGTVNGTSVLLKPTAKYSQFRAIDDWNARERLRQSTLFPIWCAPRESAALSLLDSSWKPSVTCNA